MNFDSLNIILTIAAFIVGIMLLTGHGDIFLKGGNSVISKKLYDVRKEGQVAKSKEIITAISLMSLFIILKIYVGRLGTGFIDVFKNIYGAIVVIGNDSGDGLSTGWAVATLRQLATEVITLAIPLLLVAVIIAILGNVLQQKWMITAKPMQPKLSKISP